MPSIISRFLTPVLYGVIVFLGITLIVFWLKTNSLEKKLLQSNSDILTCKVDKTEKEKESDRLRTALSDQTSKTESLRADNSELSKKIDLLNEKPEKVRYEVVYRDIIQDANTTRSNCEDLHKILNGFRNIGDLNRLR